MFRLWPPAVWSRCYGQQFPQSQATFCSIVRAYRKRAGDCRPSSRERPAVYPERQGGAQLATMNERCTDDEALIHH